MGRVLLLFLIPIILAPSDASGSQTSSVETQESEPQAEIQEESADEEKDERPFEVHWDAGLYLQGPWDHLKMKIGGDIQNDTAGFVNRESAEEAIGTTFESGGVEWRRARAYAEGTIHRNLLFKFRYDFSVSNPPNLKDAYISLVNLPLPTVAFTAGRFRAPLGLDGYTGANDSVFMERSTMSLAFLPSRNTGVMFHGDAPTPNRRIRWSVGALQPETDELNLRETDNLGYSGRFAAAFHPFKRKSTLLHLGADFWRRNVDQTIQLASRPESHLAPNFVDTGDIGADHMNIAIAESAVQRGPLTISGEFAGANVERSDRETLFFYGLYVQVSYFLSGETAPYRLERGTFTRPRPKREFRDGSGGLGAFEVGFRFSRIDLDDGGVDGGRLNDWSAGFNWYPTHYSRVMFNAILANLAGADPMGIFQMRLQIAF